MSEENAPKLRLKPKLASDPATAQAAPAAASEPTTPAQPADEAPKLVRLKPKLTPAATQETAVTPVPEPTPAAEVPAGEVEPVRLKPRLSAAPTETAAPEPVPAPEAASAATEPEVPPAATEPAAKPAFKLGLKAKTAASPAPVPEAPPAAEVAQPPLLDAPPPPTQEAEADRGEKGVSAETTAMRKVTAAPFPPPGKFPPPPGLKKALDEASEEVVQGGKGRKGGFKGKLFKYGVITILILGAVVWKAGKYFLDRTVTATIENKLFDKKEPAAPAPKPATPQGQAVATAKTAVDQAKEQAAVPAKEILEEPKPAEPAVPTPAPAEPRPAEESKPVEPPPPPPPSVAFRGWVENLKIGGVRGGANPRIFIGGSSYQPGDLVNPQMGIIFVGYNDATRILTFRDKSGAKVERRN
jgi:hypothetical protein